MKVRATFHLLITTVMFSYNTGYEEMTKDIEIDDSDDFKDVLKTTLFVDKSLLIKRFFDATKHGSGILILAPRHFGKSTNMNMIKRFCELNVDESGELKRLDETVNYKLFVENYLNIYKLRDFFKKHFGKYSVIFIDYMHLSEVKTVEQMLAMFFVKIMWNTFIQHKYLLNDTYLWTFNESCSWISKDRFQMYLNPEQNQKITESDVQTGFSFLAKLLHKRYERRVIVLIDNYDAFVDSPLFSQNSNIFHFISAINCDLLRCESVQRSMITGKIRTSGPSVDRGEILPSNIVDSKGAHSVWPYFGLSGVELDKLLQPIIKDNEEREKVMGKIVHKYSGYSVATFEVGEDGSGQMLDTQTCSVWSVVQYMTKELAVENFSSLV